MSPRCPPQEMYQAWPTGEKPRGRLRTCWRDSSPAGRGAPGDLTGKAGGSYLGKVDGCVSGWADELAVDISAKKLGDSICRNAIFLEITASVYLKCFHISLHKFPQNQK